MQRSLHDRGPRTDDLSLCAIAGARGTQRLETTPRKRTSCCLRLHVSPSLSMTLHDCPRRSSVPPTRSLSLEGEPADPKERAYSARHPAQQESGAITAQVEHAGAGVRANRASKAVAPCAARRLAEPKSMATPGGTRVAASHAYTLRDEGKNHLRAQVRHDQSDVSASER